MAVKLIPYQRRSADPRKSKYYLRAIIQGGDQIYSSTGLGSIPRRRTPSNLMGFFPNCLELGFFPRYLPPIKGNPDPLENNT